MKKIKTITIIILLVIAGYYVYQSHFWYQPNYQRVSQVLEHPQLEISFEVDVNKWEIKKGTSSSIVDEISVISIFLKNSFNEKWQSFDNSYTTSFKYTYNSKRQFICEDGNTGDSCSPEPAYEYPHEDATIINVDGYNLAIPVYLEDEDELSYPWITQLVPEYDNQMLNRMNFLNNPRNVSDYNQDFHITPSDPLSRKFWNKEVLPTLIHALETFEVKDLSAQE